MIDLLGFCKAGIVARCTIIAHDIQIMHKGTGEGTEAIVDDMAGGAVLAGHNMTQWFT